MGALEIVLTVVGVILAVIGVIAIVIGVGMYLFDQGGKHRWR